MNLRNVLVPLGAIGLVVSGFMAYGWPGVAAVLGGLMMWALLHFTRLMSVMKKAAHRPVGYVGSAVMLNAKLHAGVNLLHVVAMTQALGEELSAPGAEPQVYRWTDGTQSQVTCQFRHGKLVEWSLTRPQAGEADAGGGGPRPAP